jgi:hypothetical protein
MTYIHPLSTVQYSKFDHVICIVQTLGEQETLIVSQHFDFFPAILETLIL